MSRTWSGDRARDGDRGRGRDGGRGRDREMIVLFSRIWS